jgi:hypothetical protein
MSNRPARPEWRAAYLDRTLKRRPLRNVAGGAAPGTALAARRGAAHTPDAALGSFPMSITAMLHLVPTA